MSNGKTDHNKHFGSPYISPHINDKYEDLHNEYSSTENVGINVSSLAIESFENKRAREILASTKKRIGMRFESGVIWRPTDTQMTGNYPMAIKRLTYVESKIRKDPIYEAKYRIGNHSKLYCGSLFLTCCI